MEQLAIVASLKPGMEEEARKRLEQGPPFDLGESGLEHHTVYLSAREVVFVFEGHEVEWIVNSMIEDTFRPELELGFAPVPLLPDAPVTQQGQDGLEDCLLNLSFTTASPATWWDEQRDAASRLRADGIGELLWTAPFVPTVPGTDTYTDQLR